MASSKTFAIITAIISFTLTSLAMVIQLFISLGGPNLSTCLLNSLFKHRLSNINLKLSTNITSFFLIKQSSMDQLPKCDANYVPLTPINFLKRAAKVYGNRLSVVHERTHFTWQQTYERCLRLADSLRSFNIAKNDVVSFWI